jgi:hypothetical protein
MWFLKINISSTKSSVCDFDKHNAYKVDIGKTTTLSHACFFLRYFSWSLKHFSFDSTDIFKLIGVHVTGKHDSPRSMPMVESKIPKSSDAIFFIYLCLTSLECLNIAKHISKRLRENRSKEKHYTIFLWLCPFKETNVEQQRKLTRCHFNTDQIMRFAQNHSVT